MQTNGEAGTDRFRTVLLSTILASANMFSLIVGLIIVVESYEEHSTTDYIVNQDIWGPFLLLVLAQGVFTGLLLLIWRQSRRVAVGVLLGCVGLLLAMVAYLFLLAASAA